MKKILFLCLFVGFSSFAMQEVYQQSKQEYAQQQEEHREQQIRDARTFARQNVNLYEIMNIDKSATQQEINAAYRSLAKKLHPDRPNGDSDKFKNLNKANEILSDQELRAVYDQHFFKFTGLWNSVNNAFKNYMPNFGVVRRAYGQSYRKEPRQNPIDRMVIQARDRREQSNWERLKQRRNTFLMAARERAYYAAGLATVALVTAAPYMVTHCSDIAQAYCAVEQVPQIALQACAATLPSSFWPV